MTLPHASSRTGVCVRFLLLSAILVHAPLAAAQAPPLPPQSELTPDVQSRLAEAARDSKLEPWQREFMLGMARGNVEGGATASTPGLSDLAQPPTAIASIDGDWMEFTTPSVRYAPTAIYDPLRDRMVVFGGEDGVSFRNDVWVLSLAGSPVWSQLAPAGTPPPARDAHTAIYDPVRDRMVVFGGKGPGGIFNDVWALSLAGSPAWSQITPAGTLASVRYAHSAIYDPVRDRMVVFGGVDAAIFRNDVWALSLAGSPAWSEIFPGGTPPSGRWNHTAIYDPVRDRMVVFGGSTTNELWALSLAGSPAWSELAPTGTLPSGRQSHAAIYDPVRDRMVVFGGYDGSPYRNDLWALSLEGSPVWSELAPANTPPSARAGHTAIYDPVRDRMVVLAGDENLVGPRNDTWALSLAGSPAWSGIAPQWTPPSGRYSHTAIYDPVRDRMVVFGGHDDGFKNDVWALSLAGSPGWSQLAPTGIPPSARSYHTAIYDPVRDRMVVFGGDRGSGLLNDVWTLSLAGSPTWSEITAAGTPPSVRYLHTAVYDPVRDRMVVFGGVGVGFKNDVWALSLEGSPAWSELSPAGGPPPARAGHSAMYDPLRDRMEVFGGLDGGYKNDVWALSLAGNTAWSELTPAGIPPPAHSFHAAIYDPVRDRMVVFGGDGGSGLLNDVWTLSLAGSPAWSELAPAETPPSTRYLHSAIYDPVRDRMVVFGGFGSGFKNDVWALSWYVPCDQEPSPCGGSCPPGTTCGQFPNGTCGCFHDLPPPCASAGAPACNGICPPNQGCTAFNNSCVCVDCFGTDPGGVGGTTWSGKTTMVWDPEACAGVYNVYKLTGPRLIDADRNGAAEDYGACYDPNLMAPKMTESLAPSPGQTSYYVVTGENAHGQGTMGYASNGLPRPNVTPCP